MNSIWRLWPETASAKILIEDQRVDDLVVAPMVSPEKEGKLADAFRQMLARTKKHPVYRSRFPFPRSMSRFNEIGRSLSLQYHG